MNPERKVYDNGDEEPVTRPDLHSLENGGNTSEPKSEEPQAESNEGEEGSGDHFVKSGKSEGKSSGHGKGAEGAALGASGLAGAEEGAGKSFPGSQFGFNANPLDVGSPMGLIKGFLTRNKKQALIGGGVGAGIGGLIIGAFFLLLPLKIEHIVQNLENHFFASSKQAVGNETDKMFSEWIKTQLGPAMRMGACAKQGKQVISKDCTIHTPANGENNPVKNLYKTWSDAKLENKLADQYGIELIYDNSKGGAFYLKAPGISGEAKVGDAAGIGSDFDKVDRGTVRQAFKDAEKGMTFWDKMMFRYKVGRLLEEKYGIKRCIVFCGTRDAFADDKAKQKYAAKAFLVERVITPKSAALGAVIDCLINNNGCTGSTSTTCAESSCDELAGKATTQADAEVAQEVAKVTEPFGMETAKKLMKGISDIRDAGGVTNWFVNKALEKLGMQQLSDFAGGLVTWIPKLATTIDLLSHAGPAINKMSYLVNSEAAVSLFTMYRTYADEIHTGHANTTELGSFSTALGPGDHCAPEIEGKCGQQLGGTASAEAAPEYGQLMGEPPSGTTTASLAGSLLPGKAYAATTYINAGASNDYKCNDGKTVPKGQRVCNEEVLGRSCTATNKTGCGALQSISDFLNNTPGVSLLTQAAKILSNILSIPGGIIGSIIGDVLGALPGVSDAASFIAQAIQPLFLGLVQDVISNPISVDMSGARTFDMMAAGADVAGNNYAQTGIGGQVMTNSQTAAVLTQQQEEAQQEFESQPLFARLFNVDSPYSLVSKVAMAVPFSFQSTLTSSFASFVSNPLGLLANSFASLFSGKVSAASQPQQDAFGINQYGYPNGVPPDPQAYWDKYCTDDPSKGYQKDNSWNTDGANNPDPNTGEPENNTTNPCLLIKAATGSAGGALDSSNLTKDDLADLNGGSGSSSSISSGGCTSPFPDGWTPNRADMGYDGTFKNKIVAPCSGTITDAQTSFSNWGGWVELKLDQPQSGLASQTLYFAEGVAPAPGVHNGMHVNAGDQIAVGAASPYGNAYGTDPGGVGEIEWGIAQDGPVGSPTNTYVYGKCGSSAASTAVLSFIKWAQTLGLPTYAQPGSSPGCP